MRVALESMARAVEADVRSCGAEPATIAVIDGKNRVGLTDDELEWVEVDSEFARASPHDV